MSSTSTAIQSGIGVVAIGAGFALSGVTGGASLALVPCGASAIVGASPTALAPVVKS